MTSPSNTVPPYLPFLSLWCNRRLVWQMSKREVIGRYRGSLIGLGWSFFNPLLMLAVYTFFFSVVFRARWGDIENENKMEFAVILFAGLIFHALFAECLNRAPNLILSNVNYVKKVVFPLEVLPWVAMGSAVFHFVVSLLVLLLFYGAIHWTIQWTVVFLPLVVLPFIFIAMGISWFLAALGVYLRDVGHTTGIITTALLFLSPVFYSITIMPEKFRPFFYLNPLTFVIEQARATVLWGKMPDWTGLGIYFGVSLVVAWLGLAWFQKTRKGFADVL